MAVLAIGHGTRAAALRAAIFPYLTTVESLKLAAQGFKRAGRSLPSPALSP